MRYPIFRIFTSTLILTPSFAFRARCQSTVPGDMTSTEYATFAAGCFWGVQQLYDKHYGGKGVVSTEVGYAGGKETTTDPTYKQVCSGQTGHAEVLRVKFEPARISYDELVTFFFKIHDPTQANRQGPDVGTQYRSAIYTYSPEQKVTAEAVKQRVQRHFKSPIVTEIEPIKKFFTAEEYHQQYLDLNPTGYHCPNHFIREFKD